MGSMTPVDRVRKSWIKIGCCSVTEAEQSQRRGASGGGWAGPAIRDGSTAPVAGMDEMIMYEWGGGGDSGFDEYVR